MLTGSLLCWVRKDEGMNTRIKEIELEAAYSTVDPNSPFTAEEFNRFTKKFAELLVKKFDDILLLQQLDSIGNRDKKSTELIEKIRLNTKTYFGVNERTKE
jgi:hypothetical protein